MKRTRLRPVSKHRQKVNRERRRLQEAEWGPKDTWRCWFRDRPAAIAVAGPCFGEVWGHEILSRAQAGQTDENLLNVAEQLQMCNGHNGWIDEHRTEAERLGLRRSWTK